MPLSRNPDEIWADGPGGMPSQPAKQDIRAVMKEVEQRLDLHISSNGLIYPSKTQINADLAHDANSMGWVLGDPTAANNGVYGKVGAAGTGSWTRRADLPFSFIVASDAGGGTPNAIQAVTSIPVSGSALVWMTIADTNTGSPVTVSFNGGTPLTIKTNTGEELVAGGLLSGMTLMGIISGSTFRILNDQVSSSIVAAAEAARADAEAAAAEAVDLVGRAGTALQPATTTFAEAKRYTSGIAISEFPDINFDGDTSFNSAPGMSEMIDKVFNNGGGTIDIHPGADICIAQPIIAKNAVKLRGGGGFMGNLLSGAFGSRIRPTVNMAALITQQDISQLLHSFALESVNLDGRKGDGIAVSHLLYTSPVNCQVVDCNIHHGSGDGIYMPTNAEAAWINLIHHNTIEHNGGWGARLEITDSILSENPISSNGNKAGGTGGNVWIKSFGAVRVIGNQIEIGAMGLLLESVDTGGFAVEGNVVVGNYFDLNSLGLHLKKGALGTEVRSTTTITANKFGNSTSADIRIDDHIFGGTIVGNNMMGSIAGGVINIEFVTGLNNPGWSIIGNSFSEPAPTGFDIKNPPADLMAFNGGVNPYAYISKLGWRGTTAATVGAAGGASALPATPLGYIVIDVAGVARKIPYYNT